MDPDHTCSMSMLHASAYNKSLSTHTVELYTILTPAGALVALLVISLVIIAIMGLALGKCI